MLHPRNIIYVNMMFRGFFVARQTLRVRANEFWKFYYCHRQKIFKKSSKFFLNMQPACILIPHNEINPDRDEVWAVRAKWSANERRAEIMWILESRKYETMCIFAFQFGVSVRIIRKKLRINQNIFVNCSKTFLLIVREFLYRRAALCNSSCRWNYCGRIIKR